MTDRTASNRRGPEGKPNHVDQKLTTMTPDEITEAQAWIRQQPIIWLQDRTQVTGRDVVVDLEDAPASVRALVAAQFREAGL